MIWAILSTYLLFGISQNLPIVREYLGKQIGKALSHKLGTEVYIGSVEVGMFHRIIIDDVLIKDKQNTDMLKASRISAKIHLLNLITNGSVSISSAQVFGLKANLYKKNEFTKPNFRFVLDSLASKDTTKHNPLDLEISSLIIRRSEIAYNQLDVPDNGKFSIKHLNFKEISAHVIVNTFTEDSLSVNIKRVAFKEKNGLAIKRLSAKIHAGKTNANLTDFTIQLPRSLIEIPSFNASYRLDKNNVKTGSLKFNAQFKCNAVTPSDLSTFTEILKHYNSPVTIDITADGTDKRINISKLQLKQGESLSLASKGMLFKDKSQWNWKANSFTLETNSNGITSIAQNLGLANSLPKMIDDLKNVSIKGQGSGRNNKIEAAGTINSGLGKVDVSLGINKTNNQFRAEVESEKINLSSITGNKDLGVLTCSINANGSIDGTTINSVHAVANVNSINYKNHDYVNSTVDVNYIKDREAIITANVNDEYGSIDLDLNHQMGKQVHTLLKASARKLNIAAIGLGSKYAGKTFSFDINANIYGKNLQTAKGNVQLRKFAMQNNAGEDIYKLNILDIYKGKNAKGIENLTLNSDFASLLVEGDFDYRTLYNSISSIVYNHLPTLPGIKKLPATRNKLDIFLTITKTDWAEHFFGIPLELEEPAHLIANIDEKENNININLDASKFTYNNSHYEDGYIIVSSPNDTLKGKANIKLLDKKGNSSQYIVRTQAVSNRLTTQINFISNGRHYINGMLNTDAVFYNNKNGLATADISIKPSEIHVGDTIWNITPANISYYKNHLEIDNFSIRHGEQHININGSATNTTDKEIKVNLKDVNVSYILDLVNFHSVEFAGFATGNATVRNLFGNPVAEAKLYVKDFHFENGLLGNLTAEADWTAEEGDININAHVAEKENLTTIITGYVSPQKNYIDLKVNANNTSLKFLENYCNSFAENIDIRGVGKVNVVGPFSGIQLIGEAVCNGEATIKSLNTTYSLKNTYVELTPGDIHFKNDTILDRNGNIGIVNGHLWHKNLSRLSFDININAKNMLAYDTKDFDDMPFYGTIYATGTCNIRGKSGILNIDVEATPDLNTVLVYNATSPDAITNGEFIHWGDRNTKYEEAKNNRFEQAQKKLREREITSDLYMNFIIHCNNNATIRLLMDSQSGDYISLNGSGILRASYYDKGAFEIFGNYIVNHGIYKLTIQGAINRNFDFVQGGMISFGGNAYDAKLNMQAKYTLNSVPLSDINIGKSFSNSNVRVDCIMNIEGTPERPRITFGLDMPTVGSDAKKMVMSLMDNNEEINQQVIYLLAVGRFLNQNANNATMQGTNQQVLGDQASLAMQSILSGTVSQELSRALKKALGSSAWNIGANISTGDEGWNNAEYEGIVSGHLLNNRLLINGQFGYRDNQNATSSFIGDFDVRYLLVPSGSMAVRMYNQTNDRYFTKNSLNTQGIGLIFKKDFAGWNDFWKWLQFSKRKKNQDKK